MQSKSVVDGLNDIRKFAVYRTANKLNSLRKLLRTEHIPYKLVLSVLDIYRLNSIDLHQINEEKLENVFPDTFFAATKQGHFANCVDYDIETSTKSLTDYLLNMFKSEMLDSISTVLTHIDSDFDMGDWHQCDIIDEWFALCPGIVGLTEYQFTSFWVGSKSTFRNYAQLMAISQRIMDTKDIEHNCMSCKATIRGLQIECSSCSNSSLCFPCFCVETNVIQHAISHQGLGEFHLLNKCFLFLKKCWSIINCRNDNIQSLEMATIKTNFVEFRNEFTTITNPNAPTQDDHLGRTNSYDFEGKLPSIIKLLLTQNEKLRLHLDDIENLGENDPSQRIIHSHLEVLKVIIRKLEEHSMRPISSAHFSSTPYRKTSTIRTKPLHEDSYLSKSLKGAEINKSFLDQNNSNLSVGDVSSWLHRKRLPSITRVRKENLATVSEVTTNIDTNMLNFKELLHIVKDIIEDTYSNNMELSKATNQMEYVLDSIFEGEEKKRLGR